MALVTSDLFWAMKRTQSKTDWDRVLAFKEGDPIPYQPGDCPYDPNDTEATRNFFARADLVRHGKIVRRGKRGRQKTPTKKLVSLRLSPEVIDHFRSTGPGWQTRIDETLAKTIRKRA